MFMLFCHVFDDYKLQAGVLNNLKQKKWWREQHEYNDCYRYDYIVGLIMHSISWSFMIMLPLAIYLSFNITLPFVIIFLCNVLVHAVVDDLKANRKVINLVVDQAVHMVQIAATAILVFNCI
jgi:hypothetical protein